MSDAILDVDLLAFESGDTSQRKAVVDGVMKSLETGFVYTAHDMSSDLLDQAYAHLETFFALDPETKAQFAAPGTNGQRGYTGLLVETAASSDAPDWKEMLNFGVSLPEGHPLRAKYPHRFHDNVFPDAAVPGIGEVLLAFHEALFDLQTRFLRIIALGIGCDEHFFDAILPNGATLSRAIHYPPPNLAPGQDHVWAAEHGDINLITALPRATARGLQVKVDDAWVDAVPPADHAIINTGIMLEHITNGRIAQGIHRVVADPAETGDRISVVQFAHPTPWTILSPVASCVTPDRPQRFAPITAADRLDQVLWEINLIEDARRVTD